MGILARSRRTAILGLAAAVTTVTACGITPQQEVELGRQYAAEINRQLPIVEDAALHRYINLLGNQIAQHAVRDFAYNFYIVNIDGINAFAVPGGFVYVNRGLVEATANLSELAGVLAHEIGHVDLRHGAEQLERMQRAEIGLTAAYVLLGRPPTGVERVAIDVGAAAVFARHSREAEREADAHAVRLLPRAGINPTGLVTFFQTLLAEAQRRPIMVEQWFATHPLTEDRIAETRAMIRQIPQAQLDRLVVNTTQYQQFKSRMAQYPQPPPEYRVGGR